MKLFTEEELTQAADKAAMDELGAEQYASNPDAVEAITNQFKAGAVWLAGLLPTDQVKTLDQSNKYVALGSRVETKQAQLDAEGNNEGLDIFGEMLLAEFGWM